MPGLRTIYQGLNRQWYARVAAAIARRRAAMSGDEAASPSDLLPTAYALGGMIDEFLTQLYLRATPHSRISPTTRKRLPTS